MNIPLIGLAGLKPARVAVSLVMLLPLGLAAHAASAPARSAPVITPAPSRTQIDPCLRSEMTLREPPYPPPASLTATVVAAHTVDLTWPRVDGVSYYRVFGSSLPAAGVVVITQPFHLTGVPTGSQTYTVSAEYPCVSNTRGLPRAEVSVQPFFGVNAQTNHAGSGGLVNVSFDVATVEPLTFRLWRDDGRGGAETEVSSATSWVRGPSNQAATTHVTGQYSTQSLSPNLVYKFRMAADFGNGSFTPSGILPVSIPEFIVRSTIPLTTDRVVIEWNAFGLAPYQIKKGVLTPQPNGNSVIATDFIKDAAGVPIKFTAFKFDDTIVQHGVTYYYEVCAPIGAPYTSGYACPRVAVTVP